EQLWYVAAARELPDEQDVRRVRDAVPRQCGRELGVARRTRMEARVGGEGRVVDPLPRHVNSQAQLQRLEDVMAGDDDRVSVPGSVPGERLPADARRPREAGRHL